MKITKYLIFTIISSNILHGQIINVTPKWHLVGAIENISNMSVFVKDCVSSIYTYNDGYSSYIPSNISSGSLTNIATGDGFWLKGINYCQINTKLTPTTINDNKPPIISNISLSGNPSLDLTYITTIKNLSADVYSDDNYTAVWSSNLAGGVFSKPTELTTDYTIPKSVPSTVKSLVLQLTVVDKIGQSATKSISLPIAITPVVSIINTKPVINNFSLADNSSIDISTVRTIDLSANIYTDDNCTYLWSSNIAGGKFSSQTSKSTTYTFPDYLPTDATTIIFTFTATDTIGQSTKKSLTIQLK